MAGVVLVSTALAGIGAVKQVAKQFAPRKLVLVSSRVGRPIVTAERMVPGDRTRGFVKVKNKGTASGVLYVRRRRSANTLGLGDGRLSDKLFLTIYRVGRHKGPGRLWRGYLGSMGRVRIGVLKPGEVRRYRFVVQFRTRPPLRGAQVDNLYMGSRYTTDFVIRLVPRR